MEIREKLETTMELNRIGKPLSRQEAKALIQSLTTKTPSKGREGVGVAGAPRHAPKALKREVCGISGQKVVSDGTGKRQNERPHRKSSLPVQAFF